MTEIRVLEAFGEPIADGGQEAFVFGFLDKMDLTGIRVDCLTAYDCRSEHYRRLLERKGGKIYALDLPFAPGKSRNNIAAPLRAFLREHHYDVIHIHSGSISVLAVIASVADKAGVQKVIVHSHCGGDHDSMKHKILRWTASAMMSRHVDRYCACSQEAADWKFEKKYASQALIIKNGVDTQRFQFDSVRRDLMRERLGVQQRFVIGHVGRFTREKNQKFLISVFLQIARMEPEAVLLFVGDGEERESAEELVRSNGLEDRVIFAGSVTNVENYLGAMDLFVFPSLFEGLGIAAIEAQCSGLPVIASDRIPRDIDLGSVRFVPLDEGCWVRAIREQMDLNETDLRADAVKKVTDAGFGIEATAARMRKLYLRSTADDET